MKDKIIDFIKWQLIKIFGKKTKNINGDFINGVYEFRGKLWEWKKNLK